MIYKLVGGAGIINALLITFLARNLPDIVPIHMDYNMVLDGWGSKWFVVLMAFMPVGVLLMLLGFRRMNSNNPKVIANRKYEDIIIPMTIGLLISTTWLAYYMATLYNHPQGVPVEGFPINLIVGIPLGILMVVLSNYMSVIKHNHYMGIRVSWTLMDERVWKKTHRLGGKTGVLGGLIIILGSLISFFTGNNFIFFAMLFIGIILSAIIPIIYSAYIYYGYYGKLKKGN